MKEGKLSSSANIGKRKLSNQSDKRMKTQLKRSIDMSLGFASFKNQSSKSKEGRKQPPLPLIEEKIVQDT